MLRKFATEQEVNWDKLLTYLLFAYREVPQASTGLSPFKLLYARPVRGPLDILKASWEALPRSPDSVISHVLVMRERLQDMVETAQANQEAAEATQKRWYDAHARTRSLEVGEQVLVLLPTSHDKLLAKWEGPYPITKKVGSVSYEVHMYDKRKPYRVLHINMLRKWHVPAAQAFLATSLSN